MEIDELKKGLMDIQQGDEAKSSDAIAQEQQAPTPSATIPTDNAPTPQPWLSKENLMSNYGSWFNNNESLGEMLLGQLRANGVDTQSATEAMLRDILYKLNEDNQRLTQELSGFMAMLSKQAQQSQAVANAINTTLEMSGASPVATDTTAQPQLQEQAPAPEEQAPSEQPAPEQAPAPEEQAPTEGTVSDARKKNIKYVLSDAGMKNIKKKLGAEEKPAKKTSGLNASFIAACQGGC